MAKDTRFLQGDFTGVADLRGELFGDVAHAVFVRSTVAHGLLRSIETTAASAAPGVLAVVTAETNPVHPTVAYSPIHPTRFAQPLLAEHKVRYVGEPIVAIVAETASQALDAAEHVVIEIEEIPAVVDLAAAARDEVLLFGAGEQARRNSHSPPDDSVPTNVVRREIDDAIAMPVDVGRFEQADIVVDLTVINPRQVAAPVETRAALAVWLGDDLHVWLSTQTPHAFRSRIAPMYDIDPARVHVIAGPDVGGGFGGKGAPGPEEQLVPHLARIAGRPVRWVESRTENLMAAPQGRAEELTVRLAGSVDGRFDAIRIELLKDAGAYPSSGAALPNSWSWPMTTATYDLAHAEFTQTTVVTNRPPVSALRGAGRAPIIGAIERAVDRYAARCGLDPLELRRMNLVRPDRMPYTAVTGFTFDEADYPAALDRAAAIADYDELRAEQQRRRSDDEQVVMGIGIANYNHRTCGGGGEIASVHVDTDGSATIVTGTTSQGQDHEGTWRSIASAELGIAPERITVIEGHTDAIDSGVGAVGSRSVQTAGVAIQHASGELVARAGDVAASLLEAAAADIVLDRSNGVFHVAGTPTRAVGWAEVAVELDRQDERLQCEYYHGNDGNDVYPSGCHVAVVDVDLETGRWHLRRFIGVDDAGVRVNPAAVEGQLHGGIALGIAQAFGEEASYDSQGQPGATNFLDYQILTADQVPSFELEPQVVPTSFNPGGWKAVGESGPIGAMPAVQNAVLDAVAHLGIDHLNVPLTPQRLWRSIRQATQSAG